LAQMSWIPCSAESVLVLETHLAVLKANGYSGLVNNLDLSESKLLSYRDLITITEEAIDVDFEFVNQALASEFRNQANQGSAQERRQ
jgi:hypothetical protein